MLPERSFRRRAGVLNRPSPLVILGGEEELWSMLRRFSTYPMAEPGETIKTVIPNHFDAGNSAWLQKEIQDIWSRHWFVRLMAWLERRLPLLAALLRRAFRLFGVEIVKTIPAPGAFLYGFAVGDRRRIFERVLFYRSDRALPLASEVIAAVKAEARLTFANFEHDKEVQRLFGWLERYARRVDDQLVRKGRLDLNGLRSDEARGVRSVSVRNILYLGVMLEACRPGRISLRGYRKALHRLAEVLDSSSVAIHASLAGSAEALPVGHLAAPEDLTLPDGSRVHSDRIEGQWGLKTIRHGGPLDRVQVVSPTTGQPAAPEAVPDAVEAIARAEQLLIMPENLLSDLAAYLSSPGIARALVERKRLGKATDLGLPVTTKDGNPSTFDVGVDDALRRGTGYGLADIVTHVFVNDISQERDEELRARVDRMLRADGASLTRLDDGLAARLLEQGVAVLRGPLADVVLVPSKGMGLAEPASAYQVAPNRLAWVLRLQGIVQKCGVAPVWLTDIDGTIKKSGPTPLGDAEAEELACCYRSRALVGLLTGGASRVVDEVTVSRVRARLAADGTEDRLKFMPVQTVAAGLLNIYEPAAGRHAFESGVVLEEDERFGPEKVRKLRDIFDELVREFDLGRRNVGLGFRGADGSGFRGSCFDHRTGGVTFAVLGRDPPQEEIDRYNALGGKRLNTAYKDFLERRCREEKIPMKWALGSEFQIDGTPDWVDKGYGVEQVVELLGIPPQAVAFSGDNIDWDAEGQLSNDTRGAQAAAGVVLNMSRHPLSEPVAGRTVIMASKPGDEGGILPYVRLFRNFHEAMVPDSLKDDQERRLDEGLARARRSRLEGSPGFAGDRVRELLAAGRAQGEDILRWTDILIRKGGEAGRSLAGLALKRLALEDPSPARLKAVDRQWRDLVWGRSRPDYERCLREYQAGALAPRAEWDKDAMPVDLSPLEETERSRALEAGRAAVREGRLGYVVLLDGDGAAGEPIGPALRPAQGAERWALSPPLPGDGFRWLRGLDRVPVAERLFPFPPRAGRRRVSGRPSERDGQDPSAPSLDPQGPLAAGVTSMRRGGWTRC